MDSGNGAPDMDLGDDSPDTAADAVAACAVITLQGGGGSCDDYWFSFNGTVAQCSGVDAGSLPSSQIVGGGTRMVAMVPNDLCQRYCPPNPANTGGVYWDASPAALVCSITSDSTGTNTLDCSYGAFCGTGRRPGGLRAQRWPRRGDVVARQLALSAYLEWASVFAFEHLAVELEAHGAPRRFAQRAQRAAKQEIRHARIMGIFAERAGGTVVAPRVRARSVRSLEAIAVENAVEGCVYETFGAAVAMVQAKRARRPALRDAMRRIARDEASHAQLAWDLASWMERHLDAAALNRVRRARDRAAHALLRSMDRLPHPRLVSELGLPPGCQARRIASDLAAALWIDRRAA